MIRIQSLNIFDSAKLSSIVTDWLINAPELRQMGVLWTEKSFQEELERGKSLAMVSPEGEILCFILFRELNKNLVEINYLATLFEKRQRGFMEQLFRTFLRENEGKEVWLEVHEKNSYALNFYKKLGLVEVGRRPHYYPDGASAIMFNFRG